MRTTKKEPGEENEVVIFIKREVVRKNILKIIVKYLVMEYTLSKKPHSDE